MGSYLQLFARPRVRLGEQWQSLKAKRPLRLLSVLALSEGWVARNELLLLFWPDEDETRAKHNLRQLLYRCRAFPWVSELEIEEDRVRWRVATDVAAFQEAVKQQDWEGALQLYQGEFLAVVQGDASGEFESWLAAMRREFFESWQDAVLKVAAAKEATGKHDEATALLEQVLKQDDLAEGVVQATMRVLALAGRPEEALRVFSRFTRRLRAELEMAPLEATQELAERIRTGELAGVTTGVTTDVMAGGDAPPLQGELPQFMSPFVGRVLERTELVELFRRRRLVTVVGVGGIGKTRVALELLEELRDGFRHGAFVVSLAPLISTESIPTMAAAALGVTLSGRERPEAELMGYLQDREVLLLFDNFEHLLDGAGLVADILEASPESKILVTSREPLEIPGETVYELGGLNLPLDEQKLEDYDAVQLFLRSARRAHADFSLLPHDRSHVARLVRLLEGSPLAIELASAWVRLLSLEELVEEICRSVDLLSSTEPGRPERHRSLRAVFEHSWELLSTDEQQVFAALSVFRGGFERAAALEVAGASLRTLLVLVNKSLVRKVSAGRFDLLEVLRQLAGEKLVDSEALLRRHAMHFLSVAEAAEPQLRSAEQAVWLERLETEHDNLRSALQWAEANREAEVGVRLAGSLWRFWWVRGYLSEGRTWSVGALSQEGAGERTAARTKVLDGLGVLAKAQSDYAASRSLFEESLGIKRELRDDKGVAWSLSNLGNVVGDQGDHDSARALFEESLELFRELGDERGAAALLNNLGHLKLEQGDYASARTFLEESLEAFRDLGDKRGIAMSLNNLGDVARDQHDYASARSLYEEGLEIFWEFGDTWSTAIALTNLGTIAQYQDDWGSARSLYGRGLAMRRELGDKQGIAYSLEAFAALDAVEAKPRQAARLWGAAEAIRETIGAPLSPPERSQYDRDVVAARAQLDEATFTAAWAEGRVMPLEQAISYALEESFGN